MRRLGPLVWRRCDACNRVMDAGLLDAGLCDECRFGWEDAQIAATCGADGPVRLDYCDICHRGTDGPTLCPPCAERLRLENAEAVA